MAARWLAFLVWALVGGTAVGWLLSILARPIAVPAQALAVDTTASLRSDLTRLMGADPVETVQAEPVPAADARFKLVGVVASPAAASRSAVALIAVDGKPPRAYRVGATVDGDLVLKAVRARGAELGPRDGAVAVTLEIPPLAPPATGTLPPAGVLPTGAALPVPRAQPGSPPPNPDAAGSETSPPVAPQPITPGVPAPKE